MTLVSAVKSRDFSKLKDLLEGSKLLLQEAVEKDDLPLVEILIDAGFGCLPTTTKYPKNEKILALVKPYAFKHPSFQTVISNVDDVSICPWDDPSFVEELFQNPAEKDYKKIDYYLLNIAKMCVGVNVNLDDFPDDDKFYQFGTLEMIETNLACLSEKDRQITYSGHEFYSQRNERDPRIFAKVLDASSLSEADPKRATLACLEIYLNHPNSEHVMRPILILSELDLLLQYSRDAGSCPDLNWRITIVIELLGTRFTEELKRKYPELYLIAKRTRKIAKKYGRIWVGKWLVKSGNPEGNGVLYRKWVETMPTNFVH